LCYGDTGLLLSMPRQGLGNAAIAAVASPEQKARLKGKWASMAITEPGTGSDSANIRTTATQGRRRLRPEWRKDFRHQSGERSDCVVVWATVDKNLGRAAIKSFRGGKRHAGHGSGAP
jgi:acyl-CoA dehydrogenase